MSRRAPFLVLLLVAALLPVATEAGAAGPAGPATAIITTVAGTLGQGPATSIAQEPAPVAARGSLVYIGDRARSVVRVLDTATGQERVFAGGGARNCCSTFGSPNGDGGPATAAPLQTPTALAVDTAGNVYVAGPTTVRRIDTTGRIITVAGGDDFGFSGDGGPAASAKLSQISSVAVDAAGQIFVGDRGNERIRKVDASGVITTFAGGGPTYYETGPATGSTFFPDGLAIDGGGNLLVAEGYGRVRRIDPSGTMSVLYPVPGTDAGLAPNQPAHIALGGSGVLYLSDPARVWRVDTGRLVAAAGTGIPGYSGDGGPATAAALGAVTGLAADAAGNLYVSDSANFRLRRVDPGGTISTVAGNGNRYFAGDGGPAASAMFAGMVDVAVDAAHNLYIEDYGNNRVRRVDANGIVTTLAGNGVAGFGGDGGPAAAASLSSPAGLAFDGDGNLLIADAGNYRVRKVDRNGVISTVAGTGGQGFSGDGGPATAAELGPADITVGPGGALWVLDTQNRRLRVVDRAGTITTVAGNGASDGPVGATGRATDARLLGPTSVAVDAVGNAYISDFSANHVWKVDPGGRLSSATDEHMSLGYPFGITLDGTGRLYMSEMLSNIVRRVEPTGELVAVAGTGSPGFSGDGGRAVEARLWGPAGLTVDGDDLYIGDSGNSRIRKVADVAPPATARAWGWNHVGQLGTGAAGTPQPAPVTGLGGMRSVAAGYYHSLAVKPDGTVWAWGWNAFGQLGNGSTVDSAVPVRVTGLTGVVAVAGGAYHSLALKADGSVWAWGWNYYGQLGNGSTTASSVPAQVPGLTGVTSIAAGAVHNLVVKGDATVWGWGLNQLGQLGPGLPSAPNAVQVAGVAGATSVAAGGFHSLAVRNDGTVWSWGWNLYGQLGQGSPANVRPPGPVVGLSGAQAVAAGALHSLALTADGRVWAWGWNGVGQLGNNTTADARVPVLLSSPLRATALAAGGYHSVAETADGRVWTWGWNQFGQLGPDPVANRTYAQPVPGTSTGGNVAAGVGHTLG